MPANFGVGTTDLIRFLPEIILTVMATLLMEQTEVNVPFRVRVPGGAVGQPGAQEGPTSRRGLFDENREKSRGHPPRARIPLPSDGRDPGGRARPGSRARPGRHTGPSSRTRCGRASGRARPAGHASSSRNGSRPGYARPSRRTGPAMVRTASSDSGASVACGRATPAPSAPGRVLPAESPLDLVAAIPARVTPGGAGRTLAYGANCGRR